MKGIHNIILFHLIRVTSDHNMEVQVALLQEILSQPNCKDSEANVKGERDSFLGNWGGGGGGGRHLQKRWALNMQ